MQTGKIQKNAFTLIELLAIIVVLAIIAVITVPIILNVIDNSKKGALINSAYGYKDAVQKYYAVRSVENVNFELSGFFLISDLPSDFTVNGELPSDGWIRIEKGSVKNFSLKFDNYVVTLYNDDSIVVSAGDIVFVLPDGYQRVEYLESSGTQYIDTLFKPSGNTRVETILETKNLIDSNAFFYGSRNALYSSGFATGTQPRTIGTYGNDNDYEKYFISPNTKYEIVQTNELIVNGNVVYSYNKQTFNATNNFLIFAINNGSSGVDFKSSYKLYSMKIYDDDVLVRYFIPCYKDNVSNAGLYDMVYGVFYTDSNKTFGIGNNI